MALASGKTQALDDVKKTIAQAKKNKADVSMARALLRVGNITADAHAWVRAEYPQFADVKHLLGWTNGRT